MIIALARPLPRASAADLRPLVGAFFARAGGFREPSVPMTYRRIRYHSMYDLRMFRELSPMIPPDALKIALVLALAFFIGLEREEHKQREAAYAFGGVRTFPLIGLVSYALALISAAAARALGDRLRRGRRLHAALVPPQARRRAARGPDHRDLRARDLCRRGAGPARALLDRDDDRRALRAPPRAEEGARGPDQATSLRTRSSPSRSFSSCSVVILPVVPDRELTRFHLNPFKTWLVVVAVSGVSFASYVLQRLLKGRGGVMLSAILGGAYSSTVTTVVLARQAKDGRSGRTCSPGASWLRLRRDVRALVLLLAFFNRALAAELAPAFAALGVAGSAAGWVVSRRGDGAEASPRELREARNPLELRAAFLFALVFVVVLVLTNLAREYLGRAGLYSLAAIMGVTDVDPFILGLAQGGAAATPLRIAAAAIVIAAASNNVVKAIYAYSFADRTTGRRSLAMLLGSRC